ncbi:MAG: hypothetical protein ACO2O1_09235 [Candidatus Caldarchaeales archaeon]|jgi:hypothetical protein
MGLQTRLIDFCPKPHSESEISVLEAPNNGANELTPVDVGLRQRFITEFCPLPSGALRAQLTLTGDVIPVKSNNGNGRSADRNTRLFHFFKDPSPVLTVAKVRIIRSDNAHIKLGLPKDLQKKLSRCGRIEIHHFAGIREEHPYNVEENYLRVGTGRFYTGFYDSGETALVKSLGDKLIIVTKVGHHPRDYLQFRKVEYKSATGNIPMVKTTKGRILPLSFYVQAEKEFPSIVEVVGKPKRIKIPKKQKEKRYVSAPDL